MRLFALLLFFALAVQGGISVPNRTEGHVSIMPVVEPGTSYAVAVMVPKGFFADRAVVTISYRAQVPGIKDKLFLTRTSVVEVVPEAWVMADSIPVDENQIVRVDVVLVKDLERQRFQINEEPTR